MRTFNYFSYIGSILLILFTASAVSCSGSDNCYKGNHEYYKNADFDNGKRHKYSFSGHYRGEKIYWKVYLDDGEIVKVIKNGNRIPDSEISEYEDYLKDEISELKKKRHRNRRVYVDSDDFDLDIDVDFDSEEFAESMEKLGDALSNLDINIDLDFDWDDDWEWESDNFRESMRELKHNLRKLENADFHFNFDMDGFAEGMSEFAESMEDFEIDMSGFEESMEDLKEELENLKDFVHDMNDELVDDGYIDDDEEDYDLELNSHSMYVNGVKVPDSIHRKYVEMYVDYFGHEPENTFRINN